MEKKAADRTVFLRFFLPSNAAISVVFLSANDLAAASFLLLAGIAGAGGQFAITAAYTYAPARDISVYDYTQVIFSAVLGFFPVPPAAGPLQCHRICFDLRHGCLYVLDDPSGGKKWTGRVDRRGIKGKIREKMFQKAMFLSKNRRKRAFYTEKGSFTTKRVIFAARLLQNLDFSNERKRFLHFPDSVAQPQKEQNDDHDIQ